MIYKHRHGMQFDQSLIPLQDSAGKWASAYFENDNPIILEVPCGKGDYALSLAELFFDKNLIGVDIDQNKIWQGARDASRNQLTNIAFLNVPAIEIGKYFIESEIDEIWITFPDINTKDNLVSPEHIRLYNKVLKPGRHIRLKTQDDEFLEIAKVNFESDGFKTDKLVRDIYGQEQTEPILKIKTAYEIECLAVGNKIHYLSLVKEV